MSDVNFVKHRVFKEFMHINYHRTAPPCPAQQIEMEDDW